MNSHRTIIDVTNFFHSTESYRRLSAKRLVGQQINDRQSMPGLAIGGAFALGRRANKPAKNINSESR
ncbi:MAG: hypothetical protein P4L53_05635 [Candidatus Obscuribacterales bacterium]|nr:hypothetical protein [Candidatus Obscuribacterales bacterium]